MIPLILTVWLVLSVVTAFVLGKAIRIADEKEQQHELS